MTTAFAIKTIFEIAAVLLLVFGILHEDKLIIFEENVSRIIKRKIRMHRRRKAMEKKRAQQNRNPQRKSEARPVQVRRDVQYRTGMPSGRQSVA